MLQAFEDEGVIAVLLPAHASGVTQPLDVGVFPPFMAKLNDLILECSRSEAAVEYDL